MFDLIYDPNAWAALVTLTALEIVLGIDNIVFISVLVSRCEPQDAKRARQIGLALALIFRILLLLALTWLMRLTSCSRWIRSSRRSASPRTSRS